MSNIRYYEEFAALSHYLSFSRTSEELCVSQSALSKHIAALEQELRLTLFIRNSKNCALSEAGYQILPYVEKMLEAHRSIEQISREQYLKKEQARKNPQICIASCPLIGAYKIADLMARFSSLHPEIAVGTSEFEPGVIPKMLDSGDVELAFVRPFRSGMSAYDAIEFVREDIIAVLPKSHPLSRETSIPLSALRNDPMILIGEQAELHYVCMQLCLKAGFTPASRFNGLRPDNIMALVSLNMGVALLSQNFYEYYKRENTVGVPITPTVSTSIRLIRKKGRKLSRPAQIFWDFINQGSQKTIK